MKNITKLLIQLICGLTVFTLLLAGCQKQQKRTPRTVEKMDKGEQIPEVGESDFTVITDGSEGDSTSLATTNVGEANIPLPNIGEEELSGAEPTDVALASAEVVITKEVSDLITDLEILQGGVKSSKDQITDLNERQELRLLAKEVDDLMEECVEIQQQQDQNKAENDLAEAKKKYQDLKERYDSLNPVRPKEEAASNSTVYEFEEQAVEHDTRSTNQTTIQGSVKQETVQDQKQEQEQEQNQEQNQQQSEEQEQYQEQEQEQYQSEGPYQDTTTQYENTGSTSDKSSEQEQEQDQEQEQVQEQDQEQEQKEYNHTTSSYYSERNAAPGDWDIDSPIQPSVQDQIQQ